MRILLYLLGTASTMCSYHTRPKTQADQSPVRDPTSAIENSLYLPSTATTMCPYHTRPKAKIDRLPLRDSIYRQRLSESP